MCRSLGLKDIILTGIETAFLVAQACSSSSVQLYRLLANEFKI